MFDHHFPEKKHGTLGGTPPISEQTEFPGPWPSDAHIEDPAPVTNPQVAQPGAPSTI